VARIVEKTGPVLIDTRDGNLPYQPEMLIQPAYILRTEKGGRMTVQYLDDASRMEILPVSFIQIDSNTEGKRLEVQGGRIAITVAPQPKDAPMRLDTAISEAVVLEPGTFHVDYVDLKAHYKVEGGRIRVRRLSDGNTTVVEAGQTHVCKPEGSGKIEFGNIDTTFGAE
jgi:ferric-dicitrate binding protein FerR (iron transport regulator)